MRTLIERAEDRVAALEADLRHASEAAVMWQERARSLESDVQRLSAQLALPEPATEPASPPDPVGAIRSEVEQLRTRLDEPRAPWWAFWRRRP